MPVYIPNSYRRAGGLRLSEAQVLSGRFALRLIGDVAFQVSPQFRKTHPEIDWERLTEMRHMIEHQYGETLTRRVWLAATEGLREMPAHLEKLLE